MEAFAEGDPSAPASEVADLQHWSGVTSPLAGQSDEARSTASLAADYEERQPPLTPLDAALTAEGQRLDHERDRVLAEIASLGDELARLAQRRSTVDALLANGTAEDFPLSA